jgi:hypothetical protein
MYCPNCGAKNIKNAKFCVKCGVKLGVTDQMRQSKSSQSILNTRNLAIIGGIAIIAILIFVIFTDLNRSPSGSMYNPYSANLGFRGSGYYNNSGQEFYASSVAQFDSKVGQPTQANSASANTTSIATTVSTTTTVQATSTQPTTSIYYTTTIPITVNYGCSPIPCSYIRNGNFTFLFTLLNGSIEQWHFAVTAYNYWVSAPRVDPIIRLNDTLTGKTIYTYDYRSTITPSFFANVTPQLTNGKTAGQFVSEVQDINSELVNYSLLFSNTSIYPAQLLAQGQGDCKDKGVLMASILEAGNIQANYGMKIQLVYVDADNLTAPRTANHLMLYITYANGTKAFLDTTHVLATTPYFNGQVDGWYYNLTCTMSGCLSTPICTGAYCDEVGYTSGASGGFNYCTSGYVVAANNSCQIGCGNDYYCNSGSSCYNNQCVSCPSGYILGNDGECHAECGNSGTYCTGNSQCYNDECLSCPSGYYLGTNGQCYS